jgi:hypothetical protein
MPHFSDDHYFVRQLDTTEQQVVSVLARAAKGGAAEAPFFYRRAAAQGATSQRASLASEERDWIARRIDIDGIIDARSLGP